MTQHISEKESLLLAFEIVAEVMCKDSNVVTLQNVFALIIRSLKWSVFQFCIKCFLAVPCKAKPTWLLYYRKRDGIHLPSPWPHFILSQAKSFSVCSDSGFITGFIDTRQKSVFACSAGSKHHICTIYSFSKHSFLLSLSVYCTPVSLKQNL